MQCQIIAPGIGIGLKRVQHSVDAIFIQRFSFPLGIILELFYGARGDSIRQLPDMFEIVRWFPAF
ncbi:uncharacterized protein N7500_007110 [Penicillium coprophilum]|uniref:uncharacterized protein n=1 Tax=Penicillium coprophilum TaxID=36646 RepID=UPI002388B8DF|nr:uncharacterized protein N7500_007110 [Penicillium coprophilum]KAJ5165280.1 hypothetical protein N7500_007110 [Penicillium coprophilum]